MFGMLPGAGERKCLSKRHKNVFVIYWWHPTPVLFCLENPTDGEAWWAAVQGVAECQTRLSVFTFTFHFHALEEEMATHSSVLAWRIAGTAGPGWLLSMGSHRVRHDWNNLAAAAVVRTLAFVRSHWGHKGKLWHDPIYTVKHCFAQYMEQRQVNGWESMAEIQGRKMMVAWTNMATMMSKKLTLKSIYFNILWQSSQQDFLVELW